MYTPCSFPFGWFLPVIDDLGVVDSATKTIFVCYANSICIACDPPYVILVINEVWGQFHPDVYDERVQGNCGGVRAACGERELCPRVRMSRLGLEGRHLQLVCDLWCGSQMMSSSPAFSMKGDHYKNQEYKALLP